VGTALAGQTLTRDRVAHQDEVLGNCIVTGFIAFPSITCTMPSARDGCAA
jgi:hypothetical protein